MSNPSCDRDALILAAACFNGQVLNSNQQKALLVYFRASQLAAVGGTNYLSTLTTTFVSDAVSFARTMDSSERTAAKLAIEKNNAVAAGATISSSIDTLSAAIVGLENVPDLDAMLLLLDCKLGRAKAYPQ